MQLSGIMHAGLSKDVKIVFENSKLFVLPVLGSVVCFIGDVKIVLNTILTCIPCSRASLIFFCCSNIFFFIAPFRISKSADPSMKEDNYVVISVASSSIYLYFFSHWQSSALKKDVHHSSTSLNHPLQFLLNIIF